MGARRQYASEINAADKRAEATSSRHPRGCLSGNWVAISVDKEYRYLLEKLRYQTWRNRLTFDRA